MLKKTFTAVVSERFKDALKNAPEPAYRYWRRADVDPTTGSKLLGGAVLPRPNDPRVLRVGRLLGLSAGECFEHPQPKRRKRALPPDEDRVGAAETP